MQAAVSQASEAEAQEGRRAKLVVAKLGAGSQAAAEAYAPQMVTTLGSSL